MFFLLFFAAVDLFSCLLKCIYLFMVRAWPCYGCGFCSSFGEPGLLSHCGLQASPGGGFFCRSTSAGFSSRAGGAQQLQLPGSRAQGQQLWRHTGFVVLQHVGSSEIRVRSHVSLHWQADSESPRHQGSSIDDLE